MFGKLKRLRYKIASVFVLGTFLVWLAPGILIPHAGEGRRQNQQGILVRPVNVPDPDGKVVKLGGTFDHFVTPLPGSVRQRQGICDTDYASHSDNVQHFFIPPGSDPKQLSSWTGARGGPTCSRVDVECWRFQKLLKKWPEGKPRAALYYLTHGKHVEKLIASLSSVEDNFNKKYKYPIIIFHEANLVKMIKTIRSVIKSDLYFQLVEFSIPSFLGNSVKLDIPCLSPIGYRHMCRFQSKLVFQEPILQNLEYYWRMDDDSFLLSPIEYDVFQFMKSNDIHYGYQWIHTDSPRCIEGLWEATEKYIKANNIKVKFPWNAPWLYYNNFEISKTSMWMSEGYTKYIDYLDCLGGIYYHRWGDAPIHALAVSMFIDKNKTHLFKDIAYKHNSFINEGVRRPNSSNSEV